LVDVIGHCSAGSVNTHAAEMMRSSSLLTHKNKLLNAITDSIHECILEVMNICMKAAINTHAHSQLLMKSDLTPG